jgi:hypothetical protein
MTRFWYAASHLLRDARGVMLVELLVVVALIGMLAVLVYLNFGMLVSRTRAHAAAANLLLIRDGMLRLGVDCGGLPVWAPGGGDPGLVTRPSWAPTCWRGPYLNLWPSTPGTYEFDGPGGTTEAVVRVHSIPSEAIQPVAVQIVGIFGAGAVLRYGAGTGWSAEIPVSREYQAVAAAPSPVPAPGPPAPTPASPPGTLPIAAFRSVGGVWTVVDGRLQGSGSSKAVADATGSDYTFAVDLQTVKAGKAATDTSRVVFHYQDDKNYYAVVPRTNGALELGKMQNGKWTASLASVKNTGIDPTAVHRYEVRVVGNTIAVVVDGKALITYTDKKPVVSGGVGVANNNSTAIFGNATVLAAK